MGAGRDRLASLALRVRSPGSLLRQLRCGLQQQRESVRRTATVLGFAICCRAGLLPVRSRADVQWKLAAATDVERVPRDRPVDVSRLGEAGLHLARPVLQSMARRLR